MNRPAVPSSAMDHLLNIISGWLSNAQAQIPYVKQSVMTVTSMDCLFQIITGFICLGVLIILVIITTKLGSWLNKEDKKDYRQQTEYFVLWGICFWVFVFLNLVLFIGTCVNLLNFWAWIGISHPDLFLMHKAVNLIAG